MATIGLLRHLLLALLGCTVSLYAGGYNPSTASAQGLTVPDAVKTDVYNIDLDSLRQYVAFLHDPVEKRFLPIWIGKCEAMAIARKLYNQNFPRPLTHDLFQSVLEYTGIRITSILVDQLRPLAQDTDTFTYFAILTLRKADGTSIQIDSRPSDAMALAVRMNLPVYVSGKILDQNSMTKHVPQKPAPLKEALGDLPVQPPRSSEGEPVKTDVYNIGLDSLRQYVAFLHDPMEARFLPIWIGKCEAMAIVRKLYNQDFPRPLTHDLFQSVLEYTGIRITSILVDVLTDETQNSAYRAILTLRKADGTSIQIDSRPSDAMALAVRMNLPVYVSRKILDQDSIPEKDGPQRPPAPKKDAPQRYY